MCFFLLLLQQQQHKPPQNPKQNTHKPIRKLLTCRVFRLLKINIVNFSFASVIYFNLKLLSLSTIISLVSIRYSRNKSSIERFWLVHTNTTNQIIPISVYVYYLIGGEFETPPLPPNKKKTMSCKLACKYNNTRWKTKLIFLLLFY